MQKIISLGAGVQSTTLALMAAAGELEMPDCAVFADTQAEPTKVYRHLDWLEKQLPFPVYRVTNGNLLQQMLDGDHCWIPLHVRKRDGGKGILQRHCTERFKVKPFTRKLRDLTGQGRRGPGLKKLCVQLWLGISTDEASRMKPSKLRWVEHRWPLIERRMSRQDCLKWVAARGFPQPPKSACTFCPYHSVGSWREMRLGDPESWEQAVLVDRAIRNLPQRTKKLDGTAYLHSSLKPLDEAMEDSELDLFNNECSGLCGV